MNKKRESTLIILLCWLVYACSYMGKVNYAANINQVISFYNVDHSSAGLVSTFFFFAYGIGQVINGLFCKKYNLRWMIFLSLVVSGLVNFVVGITDNFELIKYLWLLNGFSMSILWPALVRLLSENLDANSMPKASAIMGTTVATGTVLVYSLSALFVKIDFKVSFYLPALMFFIIAFVWIFTYPKLISNVKAEVEEKLQATYEVEKKSVDYNKTLILLSICMLAFYGVATNLIKDGLTTWVPSILKEQYNLDNSISIILALALPIVSIFATAFAIKMHKRIPDFVLHCAIMFFSAGLIIGGVIAGISLNQFILTLLGSTIVCFLISSCNSIITSIFPLFMKGKVNSGLIAGILNGFCYLGSAISSYGLGSIADNFGWIWVFWTLLFVCAAVCVGAVFYILIKKRKSASEIKNLVL